MLERLDEIWLDEQVKDVIDEDQWDKFIESLEQKLQ